MVSAEDCFVYEMATPSSKGMLRAFLEESAAQGEVEMAAAVWFHMASSTVISARVRGGSRRGKRRNVERNFEETHMRYMLRYFWPSNRLRPGSEGRGPSQSETAFERRFRMPREVFMRIIEACVGGDGSDCDFFRRGLRKDAIGKTGISPLVKVIAAHRQLSYGIPSDFCDDAFEISQTTGAMCLRSFCRVIVNRFSAEYLRQPTQDDLRRIEGQFRRAGFPGCIGAVDCAGWTWKNCPKALQGLMVGKDGVPTLRMEAICDLDLWVWHFQFGFPGRNNDLNILDLSEHFCNVLSGSFPPHKPRYVIDGEIFNSYYYLADGIYPSWKIFAKTLQLPAGQSQSKYCKTQEAARKCVERLFGVLFRRYKVMFVSSELWCPSRMKDIACAAVILHNMTVEKRRRNYTGDGVNGMSRYFENEDSYLQVEAVTTDCPELRMNQMASVIDDIKDVEEHVRLRTALIQHIGNNVHGVL